MTLSITSTLIASDLTDHQAAKTADGQWSCTWLENRVLSEDQAKAAMEIAEIVAKGRDGGPDTSNYAYNTWQRVMVLAEVVGVRPLWASLKLEGKI